MTGQHRPPPRLTVRHVAIADGAVLAFGLTFAVVTAASAFAPDGTRATTAAAPTAVELTREPTGHGGPIAYPTLADPHVWTPAKGPVIANGQKLPAVIAAPVKTTAAPKPKASSPAPMPAPTVAKAAPAQPATGLLALVNADRATAGCPPVTIAADLMQEAQDQSDAQAVTDSMYHSDTGTRLAENVAYGYDTEAEAHAGWMGSPDHRKNILTCSYGSIGYGSAVSDTGVRYWTEQFA